LNFANASSKLSSNDVAIIQCEKVLEIDENNVKAIYRLGFSYLDTKKYQLAID